MCGAIGLEAVKHTMGFHMHGVQIRGALAVASDTDTRAAYRCNITYGPGYLFGFDYLKDQIKLKFGRRLAAWLLWLAWGCCLSPPLRRLLRRWW